MVPKIVAKGRSFKGAAAYLLHDKGSATTSERVEWVETHNLATRNPELAWRIMAATALDQDRLKDAAGVRKTGRKSDQPVLHMVLSWHPDEREGLSPEEMRRAAISALKVIGADDRQVLLIAHRDEEHAHVHVLCNRVSPQDGRMLSSSNDRLKLSKWAQGYEMERGQVYCKNRVLNNERRAQGEFVADEASLPYHQAAQEAQTPTDDRLRAFEAIKAAQKAQDRALILRGNVLAEKHQAQWSDLQERLKARRSAIRAQMKSEFSQAKAEIGRTYAPRRKQQNELHTEQRTEFEARESQLLGRITNMMRAIDHVRRMRGEEGQGTIGQGFQVLASAGARREALQAAQDREKAALNRQQAKETSDAKTRILGAARIEKAKALSEFEMARPIIVVSQQDENAALRDAWAQRTRERQAAFTAFEAGQALPYDLSVAFEKASGSTAANRRQDDSGGMDHLLDELERRYRDEGTSSDHDHEDDYER